MVIVSAIPHQHENERVLYRTCLSLGAFLAILVHEFEIAGVIAFLVGLSVGALWDALMGEGSFVVGIVAAVILILLFLWHAILRYRSTTFTITSERLLFHHHPSYFRSSTQTVRWQTYQESVYEGGPWDALANSGTLTIRYGSQDGQNSMIVRSLPWAIDLKHYLDKIHSLKMANADDRNLPLFVPAKKGKRDTAVLPY